MGKITAQLNADPNIPGKPWGKERVRYILSNEKYVGDSLFQKTYTPAVLTFRSIRNNGEVEKYYIANTHEAIISREMFDAVQEMLNSNKLGWGKRSENKRYNLSRKIYCGYCGWCYKKRIQNEVAYWVCSYDGVAGQQ